MTPNPTQQDEDKATPRPWIWDVRTPRHVSVVGHIRAPENHMGLRFAVCTMETGPYQRETVEANAKLIVTAVNERSALQSRVKSLEKALDDILQCFANGSMPHNDIIQAARAALRPEGR